MKSKNIWVVISVIIGIVTMAAGVAVFVEHMLKKDEPQDGYIECDCSPEEIEG